MIVLSPVSANRPASDTGSSCRAARRLTTCPLAQAPRRNLAAQGAVPTGRRLRQTTLAPVARIRSRSPGCRSTRTLGRRSEDSDRAAEPVRCAGGALALFPCVAPSRWHTRQPLPCYVLDVGGPETLGQSTCRRG